jgi:2'-5' RNA ligase
MYFLAIVLPQALNEKVLPYKEMMRERYGCMVGLKSPAHITLVPPFWMEPEKETLFISDADQLSATFHAFEAGTNDFSAFRPRTIFIALQPNAKLDGVKKKTDEFFREKEAYTFKLDTRPFHPHITIATRDLHKKDFHEAWPFFEKKSFKETWMIDGLSVLRHNKKNWDVIHTSQFKNL